jgi:predicted pyridoxine 5'-phosphate oxidase superfamily flavin-nucleotide-binding protein
MGRAYSDITFTRTIRALQETLGSREQYAGFDLAEDRRDRLGPREAAFVAAADHFYQATVSETGWPYVQHRGGPPGFLRVIDPKTLGYADYRGNVQYLSVGNLKSDDRISIIIMDYANRRRLKLIGRARSVELADDPALVASLHVEGYRARAERAILITVEGYDWNCPQHITPRFTEAEVEAMTAPLQVRIRRLEEQLAAAASAR